MFEIVSACADKGIVKGTSGFCPVAVTNALPKEVLKPLIELSQRQVKEVVNLREDTKKFYSHFPIVVEGQRYNLLTQGTQVGETADDFVVHQMLFANDERLTAGPAAIFKNESLWITRWNAKSQVLQPRTVEVSPLSPRVCNTWRIVAGDAGWAGTPVEAWEKSKSCVLLTPVGLHSTKILDLVYEAQSLMPHKNRWQIPFTIGAWHPFESNKRFWRAFDRGTQAALDSMHQTDSIRLDLSSRNEATSRYREEARTGGWITFASSAKAQNGALRSEKIKSEASIEGTGQLEPVIDTPSEHNGGAAAQTSSALRPAMNSYQKKPRKKRIKRKRQVVPVVLKWATHLVLLTVLAGLGYAVWLGVQTFLDLKETAEVTEPIKVVQAEKAAPVVETPKVAEPEVKTPEKFVPSPVVPKIASQKIVSAFDLVQWNNALNLDKGDQEQKLFTLDSVSTQISDQIEVSVETLNGREELFWSEQEQAWMLEMQQRGVSAIVAKVFCKDNPTSAGVDACEFFWQWTNSSPTKIKQSPIQAGRLVFAVDNHLDPFHLPLSAPITGQTRSIVDYVFAPADSQPSLSEYLCSKDVFRMFDWQVAKIQLKTAPVDGLWLEPEIDKKGTNRVIIPLDSDELANDLADLLNVDLDEAGLYRDSIESLLEFHGPFGVRMNFGFSPVEQKLQVQVRTTVLFDSPGQDNRPIVLKPRPGSKDNRKSRKTLESDISVAILEHLGVSGPKAQKVVISGGKGSKRFDDISDQVKLALGGLIYKHTIDIIHQPVKIEVNRVRTFGSRKEHVMAITAITFPKE